jgi:hypothetical protein
MPIKQFMFRVLLIADLFYFYTSTLLVLDFFLGLLKQGKKITDQTYNFVKTPNHVDRRNKII